MRVISSLLVFAALACTGRPPGTGTEGEGEVGEGEGEGEDGEGEGPPVVAVAADNLERSALAITGTSAADIWVAGASKSKTSLLAHFDGTSWTRIDNQFDTDLYAAFARTADDVWFGGTTSSIYHYDGTTFERQQVPGLAAHTIHGIWAAASDDVWAVGSSLSRYGFLWHYDGTTWTSVAPPVDVPLDSRGELPSFFSVWGRANDDIYVSGGNGTLLHYDGSAWVVVPTNTTTALFTVRGNQTDVIAVGGSLEAVVVNGEGESQVDVLLRPMQSAWIDNDGTRWIGGADGVVYRMIAGTNRWQRVAPADLQPEPESFASMFHDGNQLWIAGGTVLTPPRERGVLVNIGFDAAPVPTLARLEPPPPPTPSCPTGRADILPTASMARRMNELVLDAIRRDLPQPGVHARNLFHVSAAMYDAWASYEPTATGYVTTTKSAGNDADRDEAIAHAAHRVLVHRYRAAVGGPISLACADDFLAIAGYDPTNTSVVGDDPAATGNRIGQAIIDQFANDGANEANNYADTTNYMATNPPMLVEGPGTGGVTNPDVFQELSLVQAVSQNGIPVPAGSQRYVGPNWADVVPYALPEDADADGVRLPTPTPPTFASAAMRTYVVELLTKSAELDHTDGITIDVGPSAIGNNELGTNNGDGYDSNAITGLPYAANVVPRGDFGRVLAEYWADGPRSETPPGHWNVVANDVSDDLEGDLVPFASGAAVDRLAWDVQLYFALNGATHDAAVTAWSVKRKFLCSRPITIIRAMAELGQSSDPAGPSYDPDGLPIIAGTSELITDASSASGERHEHLRRFIGQMAIRSWLGEPGSRANEVGGVGWMRAIDWIPYQRRNFVSPAFPGFVSGHSTFSRAAAEILTAFTGSAYYPGGLGVFTATTNQYLVFEDGPSTDVQLQWATYYDAADQAGQSRLWGGIHIEPDDFVGRTLGRDGGLLAVTKSRELFQRP